MKVLLAVHFYFPRHSAGTEVYTARLAAALRLRHEPHLFFSEKVPSLQDGALFQREHDGVPCDVFVNNLLYERFEQTFDHPLAEQRFDEVLDRVQPDVVHLQHLMYLSLGIVRRAHARGIPVVMTLNDLWLFCARMGQLLDQDGALCAGPEPERCSRCLTGFKFGQSPSEARVLRGLARLRQGMGVDLAPAVEWLRSWRARWRANGSAATRPTHLAPSPAQLARRTRAVLETAGMIDRFLVPSETVRSLAVRYGLPEERCELLPYGFVPPSPGPAERPAPPGARRPLHFAFLGNPLPHKGVHVLIDAFRKANLPDARLSIFGGDDYDSGYYRSLLEAARGARVEFPGKLRNREVGAVLSSVDALVVPSLWLENAPLVIQEARWAGVPVIVSRLGGMEEAVRDGVDGRCFSVGDVEDLTRVLVEIDQDSTMLARWAEAAPAPFPMADHAARVTELYAELRGTRPTTPGVGGAST